MHSNDNGVSPVNKFVSQCKAYKPEWFTYRTTEDQRNRIANTCMLLSCCASDVQRAALELYTENIDNILTSAADNKIDITGGIRGVLERAAYYDSIDIIDITTLNEIEDCDRRHAPDLFDYVSPDWASRCGYPDEEWGGRGDINDYKRAKEEFKRTRPVEWDEQIKQYYDAHKAWDDRRWLVSMLRHRVWRQKYQDQIIPILAEYGLD